GRGGRHGGRPGRAHQGRAARAGSVAMTDPGSRWSDPEVARQILESTHVWAVVGCSPDPMRASYGVSRTLIGYGYEMIPIYPRETTIHGIATMPDLATAAAARPVGSPIEVVDIFRASHRAGAHVDEAIAIGAQAVWLQWD